MNYRKLNDVESALTTSNIAFPMATVIVIHLEGEVKESVLRKAIDTLQGRHVLLQSKISRSNSSYFFTAIDKKINLKVYNRANEDSWQNHAEQAVNRKYDTEEPLLNYIHVKPESGLKSELLLVLHHAIIDGTSARLLLNETLSLLGDEVLPDSPNCDLTEHTYPKAFLSWKGALKKAGLLARQMKEEIIYTLKGDAAKPLENSKNNIRSFSFDASETRKIMVAVGRQKLSLNNVISAAMLHAYHGHKNQNKSFTYYRSISFADIRNRMSPTVPENTIGCFFSMTRFMVGVGAGQKVTDTAKSLWQQMFSSGKSGDIILFAQLSHNMIKMMLKTRKFRMATTALSYIGKLDLKPQYGDIKPLDVKTYITNNEIGPSISAFGKLLYGCLEIDFTFLASEFSSTESLKLVNDIKNTLLNIEEF